jgi:predicted DNA-binding transcriptional regulator AlpA
MTDSAQPADMTVSERDAYEELLAALDARALYLRELFGIFSETDVSALTGHDPRTLTVWRSQKRGPDAVKLGRAVFYRRKDIEDWIALNVIPMDRAMSA